MINTLITYFTIFFTLRFVSIALPLSTDTAYGLGGTTIFNFSNELTDSQVMSILTQLPTNCPEASTYDYWPIVDWTSSVSRADRTPINPGNPCRRNIVGPVRTQVCGDCYAFSAAGAIESRNAIDNNLNFDAGSLYPGIQVSVQQLVSCTYRVFTTKSGITFNDGCNGFAETDYGNSPYVIYDYYANGVGKTTQICRDDSFTYSNGKLSKSWFTGLYQKPEACKPCTGINSIIGIRSSNTKMELLNLLKNGPVSTTIAADSNRETFLSAPNGFIDNGCPSNTIDHGILLVGYGNFNPLNPVSLYWKVKNSWGTTKGNNGYFYILDDESVNGLCQITGSQGYQPVLITSNN
jgi:hypothetical protein